MAAILTENSVLGDQMLFKHLIGRAYPNWYRRSIKGLLTQMVNDGVIQVDALFEQAIASAGGLERTGGDGQDFADGSDAKKCTTGWLRETGQTTRRVARVRNIRNKQGPLRVIVAETVSDQIYYFRIPEDQYRGLGTIAIYFNEDGSPKSGRWFQYRVNSFQALCA